ncbi:TetR/AcrR family transcriptional regulator [Novosphingobium sp.]|uniref:TetR/AcrR family transcriptional regulator n=1 Tax=Novosphingobium sp. TaxID=1874826 RepID=UPI003D0D5420
MTKPGDSVQAPPKAAALAPDAKRDDGDDSRNRRNRILDGARAAFMRFGYERASIADIASGAGVSRTAVYHYFPGKEDVLRAVVDELHAKSLTTAAAALEKSETLEEALMSVLQAKFGPALAVVTASPHGEELLDAGNRLTGPATRAADEAFLSVVIDALVRHGRPDDARAVADTLVAAAKGLMWSGETHVSQPQFEARMKRLVAWLIT